MFINIHLGPRFNFLLSFYLQGRRGPPHSENEEAETKIKEVTFSRSRGRQ